MNWNSMDKAARERFVLKALAVTITIVAAAYFGLWPLVDKGIGLRRRHRELEERIQEAETVIQRESAVRQQLADQRQTMEAHVRQHLPPHANTLLWASDFIHRHGRAAGVTIGRVEEIRGDLPPWARPPERRRAPADPEDRDENADEQVRDTRSPPRRGFAPFAVQVSVVCSFDRLLAFLRSMEEANPLVNAAAISVVARDGTPEQHQVRLVVEWPRAMEAAQTQLSEALESE